jgi:hypothetical protein
METSVPDFCMICYDSNTSESIPICEGNHLYHKDCLRLFRESRHTNYPNNCPYCTLEITDEVQDQFPINQIERLGVVRIEAVLRHFRTANAPAVEIEALSVVWSFFTNFVRSQISWLFSQAPRRVEQGNFRVTDEVIYLRSEGAPLVGSP